MDNRLHIYAQGEWHGEAHIIGTTEALRKLRAAIDSALTEGGGTATSFTNDGEGFDTAVVRVDNAEEFAKLAVPYTNEIAKDHNGKGPWDMKIVQRIIQECRDSRRRKKNQHFDIGGEG